MKRLILTFASAALLAASIAPAPAQQSTAERFFSHNSSMVSRQPSWITPIVEPDPRLVQYGRLSVAHQYTPARTETVNYGNGRGGGLIGWNRIEVDFAPPPYLQHNSSAADGFGDASVLGKVRIVSGDAESGNFILTAMVNHTFSTGGAKNGATTDTWVPTLAGGVGLGKRVALESTLGGTMPTGKIAAQGRSIAWNSIVEFHARPHVWFELEDNATFYNRGSHDGLMQNFITPGGFYVVRRKGWKPTHPFYIVDTGMQIATSGFHTCNHNLISEVRVLF